MKSSTSTCNQNQEQMELDNDEDNNDWIDHAEEEECDNVPKRQLIAQSDWTNLESTFDDADGQTTTGKPYDPFDSIIEAVNMLDAQEYRECTTPKYKVFQRNKAKGLILICHTSFEPKLDKNGRSKLVPKPVKDRTCFFRVQARYNKKNRCLINGNSRNKGTGPINLVHSCVNPSNIQTAESNNDSISTQRKRNSKIAVQEQCGTQMQNHSKGKYEQSTKHVR